MAWRCLLRLELCISRHGLFKLFIDFGIGYGFLINTGQLFVSGGWIHQNIFQCGIIPVQGIRRIGFRKHLSEEIIDFCICGTGIVHVGEAQTGGNGFCTLCFSGAGAAAEHEVAHGLIPIGGHLCMLADADDLRRYDVPVCESGDQQFFLGSKGSV